MARVEYLVTCTYAEEEMLGAFTAQLKGQPADNPELKDGGDVQVEIHNATGQKYAEGLKYTVTLEGPL